MAKKIDRDFELLPCFLRGDRAVSFPVNLSITVIFSTDYMTAWRMDGAMWRCLGVVFCPLRRCILSNSLLSWTSIEGSSECCSVETTASVIMALQQKKTLKYRGSAHFRSRLILSTLSGHRVKISDIRANDQEPGELGTAQIFFYLRGRRTVHCFTNPYQNIIVCLICFHPLYGIVQFFFY